MSYQ
ncbi:hypothetical protein VCHENC02_2996A, partial [Vibrio harveyi]|jgi:hypothetical protein